MSQLKISFHLYHCFSITHCCHSNFENQYQAHTYLYNVQCTCNIIHNAMKMMYLHFPRCKWRILFCLQKWPTPNLATVVCLSLVKQYDRASMLYYMYYKASMLYHIYDIQVILYIYILHSTCEASMVYTYIYHSIGKTSLFSSARNII